MLYSKRYVAISPRLEVYCLFRHRNYVRTSLSETWAEYNGRLKEREPKLITPFKSYW